MDIAGELDAGLDVWVFCFGLRITMVVRGRVIVEATELPSTCEGIFWRGSPTLWNLPGVRIRP